MRARRFLKKTRRKVGSNGSETIRFDKTKVECYNCHKRGHFIRESRARALRENRNREPIRRNVTIETTDAKALVAQDRFGYDWSDQDKEGPTNFVLMAYTSLGSSSSDFTRNPQLELQEKGVIDSGFSRDMTGNMSYLSEYKEIDGGYVAFGGDPKGGKITSKGQISTGKLDFKDVYFVKELKFNLFSVSQKCGKKNSVLFIDTQCVVLSPDFKLLDESQVLLRVPKKNNMYSVGLKNVAPSGGSKNTEDNAGKKVIEVTEKQSGVSSKQDDKDDHDLRDEFERLIQQEKNGENDVNSTNNINIVSLTVNITSIKDNVVDKNKVYGCADDPNMPYLEEIVYSDDDKDQVWTLVDLPYGKKAIGTKWIYKNKKDKRGIVMDVKSAFLYGKTEEEVYVCQPPGFEDLKFPDRVYKVEKALYGLHQALRAWYETLSTYLLDNGFQRGQIDKTLFIKRSKKFGFSTVKITSTPMETSKPLMKDENAKDIINFLNADPIKYTLTMNLTIYTSCIEQFWVAAKAKNINGEAQIHAKVDGKKVIISEATIRRDLKVRKDFFGKETPLFPTMLVQAHADMGKGSTMLSGPQHTPIVQPTTSKPQKKQKPRKSKNKDTQETQPSDLIDEALNEEDVPTQSNDPPLSRVNTLRSGEDSLKLKELMEIYINAATIATTITAATTTAISIDDITLAQALVEIKTSKPKEELKNKSFDEVQKAFDKIMSWINSFLPMDSKVVKDKVVLTQESSSKRAGDELDQEKSKNQKMEDDKESEELKRCMEIIPDDGDDVTIDATPLSIKTPLLITGSTNKAKRVTSKLSEQIEIHRLDKMGLPRIKGVLKSLGISKIMKSTGKVKVSIPTSTSSVFERLNEFSELLVTHYLKQMTNNPQYMLRKKPWIWRIGILDMAYFSEVRPGYTISAYQIRRVLVKLGAGYAISACRIRRIGLHSSWYMVKFRRRYAVSS
nr:ribonuclease H-like domain-containing protein [Tanacetum cinerariifolium]